MTLPQQGYLLRIFIGEEEKVHGKNLAQWLVEEARDMHLAGATVLRGLMGFGAHSRIHTAKTLRLTEDLPLVVEIVDTRDKLESFLCHIDDAIEEGLATLEPVEIKFCRTRT